MSYISKHSGHTIDAAIDQVKNQIPNKLESIDQELIELSRNKADNISVPRKVSDLENDARFVKESEVQQYIDSQMDEVESIAKGRATGYVFDTLADLEAWLSDSANTANLVLGDNLYIRATDVPDYWWDGAEKQQLETQKVDLSEYVKNTDYASLNDAGIVKIWDGFGININDGGHIHTSSATQSEINDKTNLYKVITPSNLEYAVKSVGDGYYATEAQVGDIETALGDVASSKQNKITGTFGQFVIIGSDGNVTTKTIAIAEEATF